MSRDQTAPLAYTIKAFCAAYQIGHTKTYKEIKAGRLKARKVGKRTLILTTDAETWASQLPTLEGLSDASR